jgi:predicted adenine nucleotide alpha hydrolase (AANH) superfamily ATPase
MVQNENKILLHACCAICSAHPISLLKDLGYEVVVYFCNPNLDSEEEFQRRLEAQKKLCKHYNVELIIDEYNPQEYLDFVKGLENEPEKGMRCDKCIELRLTKTAKKAVHLGINEISSSLIISPHKNLNKIICIGRDIAKSFNLKYSEINYRKQDGFLKTNLITKDLGLYRQSYCGCVFAK